MVDFSGAVSEAIDLEKEAFYKDQERQDKLYEDLLKVYDRGGIISCSIKVAAASARLLLFTCKTTDLTRSCFEFHRQTRMSSR